jgi:hypothetical protein
MAKSYARQQHAVDHMLHQMSKLHLAMLGRCVLLLAGFDALQEGL